MLSLSSWPPEARAGAWKSCYVQPNSTRPLLVCPPHPSVPPGHFFPLPQSILIMAELSPYPPPNSYVEVLIPVHLIVTVFGDRVFKEVIMLK